LEVLKERSGGLLSSHILKFPVVLLEALLREANPKLLTFPFHLKTGTNVFTPYLSPGPSPHNQIDQEGNMSLSSATSKKL